MIKKAIWHVMERTGLDAPYLVWRTGALVECGWFRSFREKASVDRAGAPIPWFSYPAIELLSRRVTSDMTVFEYGSGASTAWFAARVKRVVSVEHDEGWYRRLAGRVPPNVTLEHVPLERGGAYCRRASAQGTRFDVVVIDGRDRVNCARHALDALDPRGVLVWDDSDRPAYADGHRLLLDRGFRRLELVGMAPIEPARKETSIFYRPGNCLGL